MGEKKFADLDVAIALRKKSELEKSKQGFNISDGFIYLDKKKVVFKRRDIFENRLTMLLPDQAAQMDPYFAKFMFPNEIRFDAVFAMRQDELTLTAKILPDHKKEFAIPGFWEERLKYYLESCTVNAGSFAFDTGLQCWRGEGRYGENRRIYFMPFVKELEKELVCGFLSSEWNVKEKWAPVFVQMLDSMQEIKRKLVF